MAFLVVIDGDHRRQIPLEGTSTTVGRAADCEVVLPGDETVSRQHARLERGADGWTVTDLGSRNGTFVNGRRIDDSTPVADDDRVLLGSYVLLVRSDQREDLETADGSRSSVGRTIAGVGLSAREIDVVRLVCAGLTDQAISEQLFLSVKTVHSHLDRIGQKTGHRRRPELVRFAIDHGLA